MLEFTEPLFYISNSSITESTTPKTQIYTVGLLSIFLTSLDFLDEFRSRVYLIYMNINQMDLKYGSGKAV